jgi:PncC family amidohydrolase
LSPRQREIEPKVPKFVPPFRQRALGVSEDVLRQYGAVSREASAALAVTVREWAGADIGLAETGIAGPTGGAPERPAGTFWIAVAEGDGVHSERCVFNGARAANQRACAAKALEILREAPSHG